MTNFELELMRKFLIIILAISLLSILYVLQQSKLLEHSYTISSNQRYISLLVDRNKQLRYNVAKLEIPTRLEDIVLAKEEAEGYRLKRWHKIQVREEEAPAFQKVAVVHAPLLRTARVLLKMFSLDTEAVAKETNREQ